LFVALNPIVTSTVSSDRLDEFRLSITLSHTLFLFNSR